MAASILAKTYRDAIMRENHKTYPNYGWDKNVGYLTAQHIDAIKKYGLSEIHRKSYNFKFI
jgi:ribonuclease HII